MAENQGHKDVSPNEVQLRADLAGEAFLAGVRAGRWRNPVLDWPVLYVEVAVGDLDFMTMRLQVDGYPLRAPHGQPWDSDLAAPLSPARWPIGGNAGRVFRVDWSLGNQNAPYLACERVALSTHANWVTDHPERSWNASRSIDFYLGEVATELADSSLPNKEEAA